MPSISQADVEEGIRLALENANRLYQDAMLLHKNRRYRSSIGLSVFALEEFGKMLMLVQDWRTGQGCSLRDWSKSGKYLSHYKKLQAEGRITYILNQESERKHKLDVSRLPVIKEIEEAFRAFEANIDMADRLGAFFLDWNANENRWTLNRDFDKKKSEGHLKEAERVLRIASNWATENLMK